MAGNSKDEATVTVTCTVCSWAFKMPQDNATPIETLIETALCPKCRLLCIICEINPIDQTNKHQLCKECFAETASEEDNHCNVSSYASDHEENDGDSSSVLSNAFNGEEESGDDDNLSSSVDKNHNLSNAASGEEESGDDNGISLKPASGEEKSGDNDDYLLQPDSGEDQSTSDGNLLKPDSNSEEGFNKNDDNGEEKFGDKPASGEEKSDDLGSAFRSGNRDVLMTKISGIYSASHGGLGADGSGGSINGELSNAGCKAISIGLELDNSDCFCDIGSGGGHTLARILGGNSAKVGLGIEVESNRHHIAMNFSKMLIAKGGDVDVPIAFTNADINDFNDLNGVTKAYMYDPAFTPQLLKSIANIFNRTESCKLIASTQNLPAYGFMVELYDTLGSLQAVGQNMSHTFYIFKSNNYYNSSVSLCLNPFITELIDIASSKIRRFTETSKFMNAVHKSKVPPRSSQLIKILGENDYCLYDLFLKEDEPIINDVKYLRSANSTKVYIRFNELSLKATCRVEMGAVVNKSYQKCLLVPSYDGIVNGNLLVGIIFDKGKAKGAYLGVVYDILNKSFTEKPVMEIFNQFDKLNSMPFDISEILQLYRRKYPLGASSTSAKRSTGKTTTTLSPSPPRKRVCKENKKAKLKESEETKSDTQSKRQKIIEEKLKEKLENQKQLLADLQNQIKMKDSELSKLTQQSSTIQTHSRKPLTNALLDATSINASMSVMKLAHSEEINHWKLENVVNATKVDMLTAQKTEEKQERLAREEMEKAERKAAQAREDELRNVATANANDERSKWFDLMKCFAPHHPSR